MFSLFVFTQRWMWRHIGDQLLSRFEQHAQKHTTLSDIEEKVHDGVITPGLAAENLLASYFKL
eukprot:m.66290 g.66290  ORF g.66290 m.66290 type:complete len:63 (+) comp11551_c0_seq2:1102-1290(+)